MYFIITQRAKIDKSFRIADKKRLKKKEEVKENSVCDQERRRFNSKCAIKVGMKEKADKAYC